MQRQPQPPMQPSYSTPGGRYDETQAQARQRTASADTLAERGSGEQRGPGGAPPIISETTQVTRQAQPIGRPGDTSRYVTATAPAAVGSKRSDRYGYAESTQPVQRSVMHEASATTVPAGSSLAAYSPFFGRADLGMGGKGELVIRTDSSAAVANPSPVGLFAFGFLLLFQGFVNGNAAERDFLGITYAFALTLGGLAQFIAGMWAFAKKNTFGATIFTVYGAYWIGLGIYYFILITVPSAGGLPTHGLTIFYALWGGFTLFMWLVTFRISISINVFFILLTATFGCLVGGVYSDTALTVGGWIGVAAGFFAWYSGYAALVNEMWGRELVPVGSYPELYKARVERAKHYRHHEDIYA